MDMHLKEVGKSAAERLLRELNGELSEFSSVVRIEPELVIRKSVKNYNGK